MKVIRSEKMGFCMGVRRAVDLALETAKANPGVMVYTVGPLIHNPQAIQKLLQSGISELEDGDTERDLSGAVGIIRAHGIPPALGERLAKSGMELVDATCPRVIASQRRAKAFHESGTFVILVGDRYHGEIEGIAGFAPGCAVIGTPDEAMSLDLPPTCAVIAQTTVKREEYDAVCAALRLRRPDIVIVDSICSATRERQEALSSLIASCDAIVVVGGRGSANTKRLWQTAADSRKPAFMVETADELPPEISGYGTVGVTAGASTPDFVIDEVVAALDTLARGDPNR